MNVIELDHIALFVSLNAKIDKMVNLQKAYVEMFNHGIEKDMPITECEVLHERSHGKHMKKKPKKDEEK